MCVYVREIWPKNRRNVSNRDNPVFTSYFIDESDENNPILMVGMWGCALHKVAAKEPCRLVDSVKPKYPHFLQENLSEYCTQSGGIHFPGNPLASP